jgi:hypothetical protein
MATVGMGSSSTPAIDQVRALHQFALGVNNGTKFLKHLYVPQDKDFPAFSASETRPHEEEAVKEAANKLLTRAGEELNRVDIPIRMKEQEPTIQQQISNLREIFDLKKGTTSITPEPTVPTTLTEFEEKRPGLLREIEDRGKENAPKLMPSKPFAAKGGIVGGAVGFAVVGGATAAVIAVTVAGSVGTFGALAAVVGLTVLGVAVGVGIVIAYKAYKRWQYDANIEKLQNLATGPMADIERHWDELSKAEQTLFLQYGGKSLCEAIVRKHPEFVLYLQQYENVSISRH